jgi:hypothetical protein
MVWAPLKSYPKRRNGGDWDRGEKSQPCRMTWLVALPEMAPGLQPSLEPFVPANMVR